MTDLLRLISFIISFISYADLTLILLCDADQITSSGMRPTLSVSGPSIIIP